MRNTLVIAALVVVLGCSKKTTPSPSTQAIASAPTAPISSAPAAPSVIQSKDEVCNLLTTAEVSAELKQPILPGHQQAIGIDTPPQCAYLTGNEPEATGFVITLYFHPESPAAAAVFAHTVLATCAHEPQQSITALGDEAVLCSKLLVRKGNVFFTLFRQNGDAAVPWGDAAQRLASKVLTRIP